MHIDAIDHLVLTVRDLRATIAFYTRVLGMREITFGEGRQALAFGLQKVNLHEAGREYEPKAALATPGSADLCFVTLPVYVVDPGSWRSTVSCFLGMARPDSTTRAPGVLVRGAERVGTTTVLLVRSRAGLSILAC